MKNKLSLLILSGACLLGGTSCSDQFLQDKRDYSIMSISDVFNDPKQVEAIFADIYGTMIAGNGSKGGAYTAPIYGSDCLMRYNAGNAGGKFWNFTEELPVTAPDKSVVGSVGLGAKSFQNATDKNTYAGNHLGGSPYWNVPGGNNFNNYGLGALYPTVSYINNFIKDIDAVGGDYNYGEGFWEHLKGQLLFSRAWLYFDALRLYGGLPYYTTELDTPDETDRSARLSIDESVEKICADFAAAALLLPPTWDDDNYGRFTSVAAKAMISRVRLYAASPIFNASWDNTASRRWNLALTAAQEAKTAADNASMGAKTLDEWDKAFYDKNAAKKEGIIIIPKSPTSGFDSKYYNRWEYMICPGAVCDNATPGIPAPKLMIDLFPLADGKRAVDKKTGEPLNGYDDEKFFLNRDPRFYRTFAFSGCEWPGTNKTVYLYAYQKEGGMFGYTDGTTGERAAAQKSKAIVWKMANPTIDHTASGVQESGASILEYRYAEVLLNLAECYAATGQTGQCQTVLNELRGRVGAKNVPAFSDKYEAIEAVLYERFVELAYEGKRSWDTRRWLLYEGGAGFDPQGNNLAYDPNEVWGTGWRIYDGKDGRPNYTKADNVVTKLGLSPISGTKHYGEIWTYKLNEEQAMDDPLADSFSTIRIPRSVLAGDSKLTELANFYDANLDTSDPTDAPMNYKFGMDSGYNNNAQALNFRFTWRGWFYVYGIHYNQRIQEANNTWIEQNVGWNIGNTSTPDQDGTYVYCTPE